MVYMNKGLLIEECYCLRSKTIAIMSVGTGNWDFFAAIDPKRKDIQFSIKDDCLLFVKVGDNDSQQIKMAVVATHTIFQCPGCKKGYAKLYLMPDGHELKCRFCHSLRAVAKGDPEYARIQGKKLVESFNKMRTILNMGDYTKRFNAFLRHAREAGFTKVVKNAEGLMSAMKELQKVVPSTHDL